MDILRAFVVVRKSAFRLVLESVTKTIKFWGDETRRRDVRMLIPPKVLATGHFRRGETCTSNAAMLSELVPAECSTKTAVDECAFAV